MSIAETVRRCFATIAIDPMMSRLEGKEPPSRDEIVSRLGETAALAWDDVQAARTSYWRAVEKEGSDG